MFRNLFDYFHYNHCRKYGSVGKLLDELMEGTPAFKTSLEKLNRYAGVGSPGSESHSLLEAKLWKLFN